MRHPGCMLHPHHGARLTQLFRPRLAAASVSIGVLYQTMRRRMTADQWGTACVLCCAGHWEACLRPILFLSAIAFGVGGCTTSSYEAAEMSCTDSIGKP